MSSVSLEVAEKLIDLRFGLLSILGNWDELHLPKTTVNLLKAKELKLVRSLPTEISSLFELIIDCDVSVAKSNLEEVLKKIELIQVK